MKFFVIGKRKENIEQEKFAEFADEEARKAITLFKEEFIRELYSIKGGKGACMIIEASSEEEILLKLSDLPFVKNNYLDTILLIASSTSYDKYSTQPCLCLFSAAIGLDSATMQAAPAITAAFACAPDMPPNPDVTKHKPPKSLMGETPNFIRAAFMRVIVVP